MMFAVHIFGRKKHYNSSLQTKLRLFLDLIQSFWSCKISLAFRPSEGRGVGDPGPFLDQDTPFARSYIVSYPWKGVWVRYIDSVARSIYLLHHWHLYGLGNRTAADNPVTNKENAKQTPRQHVQGYRLRPLYIFGEFPF